MAEPSLKDVIERLKAEGQLVRNTGTNSIKSVKEVMLNVSSSLLDQTNILKEMLDLNKLVYEEAERRRQLEAADSSRVVPPISPSPTPPPDTTREPQATPFSFDSVLSALSGLGIVLGGLAAGLGATVGIVMGQLKAVQAFFPKTSAAIIKLFDNFKTTVSSLFTKTIKVFDDSLAFVKSMFVIDPNSKIGKIFALVKTRLDSLIKPFVVAAGVLKDVVKSAGAITGPLSAVGSTISTFGSALKGVATTVGKIFAPIAIIMTAFDTIKGAIEGFAEGGVIGALKGAVQGFFNSLIFGPLDLVKDLVSWVSSKLGFENFSSILDSFSFAKLFTDMTDSLFKGVSRAFSVITDLFTFEESDLTALGAVGKLTDFLFAGINMSINFIRGIFGFEETEEPFKLQDWIEQKVLEIFNWIGDLFSFLPSIAEVKTKLLSYLPEWMRPDSVNEQRQSIVTEINEQRQLISSGDQRNWRGQSRESIVKELQQQLSTLPEYNRGTGGFVDFGLGTPAVLHGIEAVVPKDSPAGAFLSRNFDDNFKPITQRLETVQNSAMGGASTSVVIANAPTIAPVNNNVRGNTNYNSQRITSIGNGSSGSGLGRFAN